MDDKQHVEMFDYGVLLVHGIGEHARANTLVQFGEPLIKSIQQLLKPDDKNLSTVGLVKKAQFEGNEPAHAEVTFQYESREGKKDQTTQWLFAEAWWAESFPTPTYQDIYAWVTKTVPWTLMAHFDGRFRRVGYRIAEESKETHYRFTYIKLLLAWLFEAFILILGMLSMPLVLSVLVLVLVLGLFPNQDIRNFVGKLQRLFAASIGDSFVFMGQAITNAAIVNKVRSDFSWLSSRCRQVAVIAHSQGGAVAHAALRDRPMRYSDSFITFGSGLRKLSEIEFAKVHERAQSVLLIPAAGVLLSAIGVSYLYSLSSEIGLFLALELISFTVIFALALGGLLIWVSQELGLTQKISASEISEPDTGFPSIYEICGFFIYVSLMILVGIIVIYTANLASLQALDQIMVGVGVLSVGFAVSFIALIRWRQHSGRSSSILEQESLEKERYRTRFRFKTDLDWIDIYASSDPVPNGPLLDIHRPQRYYSYEIDNYQSLFRDHTAYWRNLDGFVRLLAEKLIRSSPIDAKAIPYTQYHINARRRWRVDYLAYGRRMVAVMTCFLFVIAMMFDPSWMDKLINWYAPEFSNNACEQPIGLFSTIFGDNSLRDYMTCMVYGNYANKPIAATVLSGLIGFMAYITVLTSWTWWNDYEAQPQWQPDGFSGRMTCFLFILAFILGGAIGLVSQSYIYAFILAALIIARGLFLRWKHPLFSLKEQDHIDELRQLREKGNEDLVALGWRFFNLKESEDKAESEALTTWQLAMEWGNTEGAMLFSRHTKDQKKKEQAIRWAADNDNWNAKVELARIHEQKGEIVSALGYYQSALSLGDESVRGNCAMLIEKTDPELARSLYREDMLQRKWPAARGLAELDMECYRTKQNENESKNKSKKYLQSASDNFRKAFEWGYSNAAIRLGECLEKLGDYQEARSVYLTGGELGVKECYFRLGEIELSEFGDAHNAAEAYRRERDRHPQTHYSMRSSLRLGYISEQNNNLIAAKRHYRHSMQSKRANGSAAFAYGQLLERDYKAEPQKETRNAVINAYQMAENQGWYQAKIKLFRFYLTVHEVDNAYIQYSRNEDVFYDLEELHELAMQLEYRGHVEGACEIHKDRFLKGGVDSVIRLINFGESKEGIKKLLQQSISIYPSGKEFLLQTLRNRGKAEYVDFVAAL